MRLSPIYVAVRKLVLQLMRPIILCLGHHLALADHPGERRMYDTLRREYVWLNMSMDVCIAVRLSQNYLGVKTKFKHQRQLKLFSPSGPLEFTAANILCLLPQAKSCNQFAVIIIER